MLYAGLPQVSVQELLQPKVQVREILRNIAIIFEGATNLPAPEKCDFAKNVKVGTEAFGRSHTRKEAAVRRQVL
jgi:hypothetical protein